MLPLRFFRRLPCIFSGRKERLPIRTTPILSLNINQLPSQKEETGNTLETRGLTYSYTFYTNPKDALTGCKGIKEFANVQTFLSLFASVYIDCLSFHYMSSPIALGHLSYMRVTYHPQVKFPFIYRHFQHTPIYKQMPPVTYQLHTLCPERNIPLIVPALVLRIFLFELFCD